MGKLKKQERLDQLVEAIKENPFLTDEELSEMFEVSIQTIRLDRLKLDIPELRQRVKTVATKNYGKVKTLGQAEIVGELIDLNLNVDAISYLETDANMAFSKTKIVKGHYIFAMAESLAMACIDAPVAITGVANMKYRVPVQAGEKLVAKAKVTQIRDHREYYVHVMIHLKGDQVFRSKFILTSVIVG